MTLNKLLTGALLVQIVVFGTLLIAPAETRTQPASAAPAFDHSNCQYPDRTTNPPNGCDNSDPCDPAQVKGGSGDCLPQPSTVAPAPTITPAPAKVSECGGK